MDGHASDAAPDGSLAMRSARCARHVCLLSSGRGVCRRFETHPRVLVQSIVAVGIDGHVVRSGGLSPESKAFHSVDQHRTYNKVAMRAPGGL